jgi:C1A family cysteine protease
MASTTRRARGRRAPSNLGHLIGLSATRNSRRLKALPPATASSWDSRTLGLVGPVKDQGQCGSCWDFSGTGVVEIALAKAGGGAAPRVLSEEYTLSCCQNGGCNGDDNTTVLAWAKANGLPLTSAYGGYQGGPSTCTYSPSMVLYKITDWGFADSDGGQGVTSVAAIKSCIQAYGCVGSAIAADDAFEAWGDNSPSFSSPFAGSGSTDIDHDIILVGWQDTGPSAGYWILRNSWGADWGVGGYMAISYGANLVGTESVFAVVDPAPPTPTPTPIPTPTPTPIPTPTPTPVTVLTLSYDETAETVTLPAGYSVRTGLVPGAITIHVPGKFVAIPVGWKAAPIAGSE